MDFILEIIGFILRMIDFIPKMMNFLANCELALDRCPGRSASQGQCLEHKNHHFEYKVHHFYYRIHHFVQLTKARLASASGDE